MVSPRKKTALVLLGPTGVGKTYLSTLIAKELSVEIISADSRQVYKFLNIGTAKPAKRILKKIPHHFVDILTPDKYYSAGQFGIEARQVIAEIFNRGNVSVILGGSGLYVKALLEGFFQGESNNEKIRESLQFRMEIEGSEALYQDLLKIDESSARKIHPNNHIRIIRALEVFLASGTRLSDLQKKKLPPPDFFPLKFGIIKDRKKLYQEINKRVDQMFKNGLLAEVAHILDLGYDKNLNSLNSVGYKEVIQYLDGTINYETCVAEVKKNSRRYAKRQLTWFRADSEIKWLEVDKPGDYKKVSTFIIEEYRGRTENKENCSDNLA